ncbi:metalloregulator ArsR/SmtB family transcription factor [Frankia sp. Ag45/Mut15]|uniref:Metalloregulator ArsR/SmtB family transcription factor n=1 Tax=Frankia umida TaxID=573489 RepID=A0ABT0JXS2_9ACTN|nr:metalloregulator ArsR/SmtB family transcription factor [Frankia umida]
MRAEIDGCQCLGHAGAVATTSLPAVLPARAVQTVQSGEADLDAPPGAAGVVSACCTPLTGAPLSSAEADTLAAVLRAIAVPTRLRLLSMIYAREGGEACVCELTEPLGLTQPTISHHLKVLVDAGLLTRDKRGVWAYYRAVPGALAALGAIFAPPARDEGSRADQSRSTRASSIQAAR